MVDGATGDGFMLVLKAAAGRVDLVERVEDDYTFGAYLDFAQRITIVNTRLRILLFSLTLVGLLSLGERQLRAGRDRDAASGRNGRHAG